MAISLEIEGSGSMHFLMGIQTEFCLESYLLMLYFEKIFTDLLSTSSFYDACGLAMD